MEGGEERILSTLYSVWGGEQGFMKRGREGILVLTSKRVAFISKTGMSVDVWKREVDTQVKELHRSRDPVRISKAYTLEMLNSDLENYRTKNLNIPLENIMEIDCEEKRYASILTLVFKDDNGSSKRYTFTVVRSWIRYPVADPVEYEHVDWSRWIALAKRYI
ncbi:MAG: hypothetical protein ACK4FV_06330 [Candidatus Nitrosocaldus sp.]